MSKIVLRNVQLINWYGFSNVTAPIGFFTLILDNIDYSFVCAFIYEYISY